MSKSKKDELLERTEAVKKAEVQGRHLWWLVGEQAWHVHQKALWKEATKSFQAWLEETVPMSRRSAYDAMNAWGELHVLDGFKDIPKENAKVLFRDVPKSKRPRYLKNAKIMPSRKFKAFVEGGKVGAAKAEDGVGKHLWFENSQWGTIEKALDYLLAVEEVVSIEAGIEYMAAEFMQDPARANWEPADDDDEKDSDESEG